MMRQIAGSFAQYEKARLVVKLRTARERKRKTAGKCEGRKSWAEINPELVRQAKRLRRRSPKGHQRSLRDPARELEGLGYVNQHGKRFTVPSVQSMLGLMRWGTERGRLIDKLGLRILACVAIRGAAHGDAAVERA